MADADHPWSLGFREADDYLGFLRDVGSRAATQPVYAIDGVAGLLERWGEVAAAIKRDVLEHAVDEKRRRFTQAYGSTELDASLLLLPLVRFMPRAMSSCATPCSASQRI